MFKPNKSPEIVPSYDIVQNLARFLSVLPRLSASVSVPKVVLIKKGAKVKSRAVINGFMNYQI